MVPTLVRTMTAQIADWCRKHGREYRLAGTSAQILNIKAILGFKPPMPHTACYRGYQAIFAVNGTGLALETLRVHLEADQKPVINGVAPVAQREHEWDFNALYNRLGYSLKYSG